MTTVTKTYETLTPLAKTGDAYYGAKQKAAKAFIAKYGEAAVTHLMCPTGNKGKQSTCTIEQWETMKSYQLKGFSKRKQEIMALDAAGAKLTPAQKAIKKEVNDKIRDNFKQLRNAVINQIRKIHAKAAKANAAKTGAKTPTAKIDGHTKVLERLTGTMKLAKDELSENCYKEVQKQAALMQKLIIEDKKLDQ